MIVRDLQPDDIPDVRALLENTFAPRGDEADLLHAWIEDDARCAAVGYAGADLVGFGLASITDAPPTYAATFDVTLEEHLPCGLFGLWSILAVQPDRRGTGSGRAIAHHIGQRLVARGTDTWLGVSWQHGPTHTSRPLFEGAGFQLLGRSSTFYRGFAATGQICPHCRPDPCRCEALLYGRCVRDGS